LSPDRNPAPLPATGRLGEFTRRRLLGTITTTATPVVLGQLSNTLMGLVDTIMVGRLGEAPLAAIAVSTLLFSAVAMTVKATDVAAQTFTARRVGEGRDDEVGAVLATTVVVSLGAGSVFMLLGLLWPDALMNLVARDPMVQELGSRYLFFRYAGMLPLLLFFQIKGVFDGIGWTGVGMGVGIGMNLVNALLNWIFIFGRLGVAPMGMAGAAVASSLSACLAAVVILGFILWPSTRRRFRILCRSNFQIPLVRPFLRIAWPPAVQTLGIVVGLLIFYTILGKVSILAVAAANVVLRITSLSFMPGVGVGAAVQTLVGQSLGRGDPRGARRSTWYGVGLSTVFMGIFGVFFVWTPGALLRLFSSSEDLIAAGIPILRLMGLVQLLDAVGLTLAGALRGAGLTREVMLVDVATGFCLVPPLTWLFAIVLDGGLMGAWLALLTWFTLYAVGMAGLFFKSRWEEVEI
jgi:putative MATE family efflux protein